MLIFPFNAAATCGLGVCTAPVCPLVWPSVSSRVLRYFLQGRPPHPPNSPSHPQVLPKPTFRTMNSECTLIRKQLPVNLTIRLVAFMMQYLDCAILAIIILCAIMFDHCKLHQLSCGLWANQKTTPPPPPLPWLRHMFPPLTRNPHKLETISQPSYTSKGSSVLVGLQVCTLKRPLWRFTNLQLEEFI